MIKNRFHALRYAAAAMLALGLLGCEQEGPAEKAGKEIDKALSQAGQEIEKVGDSIQDAARTAQK